MADAWPELRLRRPLDRPARLVVANRKGGSGKTTTAVQLAAAYAAWGLRVRLTDGDPQLASATYWLPPQRERGYPTLLDVFLGEATLAEVTAPTAVERVSIVPSLDTLGRVEQDRPPGADLLLAREYDSDREAADVEIMDAPPSMGAVTVAMLAAAHGVVITQRVSSLDYVGVAELARPLDLVRRRLNPDLTVAAVVLIAANERASLTGTMLERLTGEYPEAVVHTVPHSVRATEAPGQHRPLLDYAPGNPVTEAYWQLAAMLAPRIGAAWQVAPGPALTSEAVPTP